METINSGTLFLGGLKQGWGHAGEKIADNDVSGLKNRLKIYFVWSLLGFLDASRLLLKEFDLSIDGLREYFDKRKLSG